MDRNQHTPHVENNVAHSPQKQHLEPQQNVDGGVTSPFRPDSGHPWLPQPGTSSLQDQQSLDVPHSNGVGAKHLNIPVVRKLRKLDKKWQKRLYWIVPLVILAIVLVVLFEVYKSDFERWVLPLTNWLQERAAWSWVFPVIILFILSFPPLFGHEIVQLIVGLTYPLGVAIGIACAGAILGEAGCFVVFKYSFTQWVDRRIATKVRWAAVARVTKEVGYRGVLLIRYSIVPPHLANPLFACTGMTFWVYMTTVILSLPKSIIFVILGTPTSENSTGAKYAKLIAVCILVAITFFASRWMRTKLVIAIKDIETERGIRQPDEELDARSHQGHEIHGTGTGDTSHDGVATTTPLSYQNGVFTENGPSQR